MKKAIIINASISGTRVAILEDGHLVELFVERPERERMIGNIYKGVVENVFRGMGACFVQIGQPQNAFLRFSDIGDFVQEFGQIGDEDEEEENSWKVLQRERQIKDLPLVTGQEILVQITKEPINSKGARVTSEISIPGRFLVLVPGYEHVGVSRKIDDPRERRRLKKIARQIRPPGFGLIVRTVAAEKNQEVLEGDLENLLHIWEKIQERAKKIKAPALVYKDMGTVSSVIRDLFTKDVNQVVVDSRRLYREIVHYLQDVSPHLVPLVELYRGKVPVFDAFNIEPEIDKALSRKVWLKSGGYLIFDYTEAMVVIDVNSGKYVSRGQQEESSLRINLEAAQEIARQLRLRDIGGIVVIDFIDMQNERNKMKLYTEFKKALRKDRATSTVLPLSEFGLMQLTRERIRPGLLFALTESCPTCDGIGHIASSATVATKIELAIRRLRVHYGKRRFKLIVHPKLASYLTEGIRSRIRRMMWRYLVTIDIQTDNMLMFNQFRILSKKDGKDLTELAQA
ncbi:ribonuclease E/G [candidate division KSB1 bacterium]|nr:MAG: ribonuclease E/G [candidate division KSB1 bacterium]RKY89246.1 MAG: ribonuclease E/G [candidate division KSB1 bacterium]RKY91570.1 MAG: ribonuclease E/G [candidate division KSB1 bacterium]